MIVATNRSDAILKRALGKGNAVITTLDRMCEQFKIDPTIASPARDAYIVTNEDISSSRTRALFEQSLAEKHPLTKIIFINKSAKPIYPNGFEGIDMIINKPKPNDIAQAISNVVTADHVNQALDFTKSTTTEIPAYRPEPEPEPTNESNVSGSWTPTGNSNTDSQPTSGGFTAGSYSASGNPTTGSYPTSGAYGNPTTENAQEQTKRPQPTNEPEDLPLGEITYEDDKPTEVMRNGSRLVDRIKNCNSVANVAMVAREISASELIKDLIESNSTYAGIEDKLSSLNDTIYAILGDTRITLSEKLSKIHAVMHDKAFFNSKGDTLIEQRLEEVIDTICLQTSTLLDARLSEIDTAIKRTQELKDTETNSARLSGLNETRANIIIELRTLENEIAAIYKSCDKLVISEATELSARNMEVVDNQMINAQLKARGSLIVSNETLDAIRAAMTIASDKLPDIFRSMKLKIVSMNKLLGKLFDLDNEIIAAQQAIIDYLKAQNIEDTVVAESILKQSLRVYIGPEGAGMTIIPYLISKYKSRSKNVLLVNLTGTDKFADYGINPIPIDDFIVNQNQQEFAVVAGHVENTPAVAQKIASMLIRCADYYRIINVVLSPEQKELFQTIAQDVLSVNFITDTESKNVKLMKDVIAESNVGNVGRRVIINKADVAARPIITKLGLDEDINFQLLTIRRMPAVTEASLSSVDPYGISSVSVELEEVVRHA